MVKDGIFSGSVARNRLFLQRLMVLMERNLLRQAACVCFRSLVCFRRQDICIAIPRWEKKTVIKKVSEGKRFRPLRLRHLNDVIVSPFYRTIFAAVERACMNSFANDSPSSAKTCKNAYKTLSKCLYASFAVRKCNQSTSL